MMMDEAWQAARSSPNNNSGPIPVNQSVASVRQRFLFDVALALRSAPANSDQKMADLLAEAVADAHFLQGLTVESSAERYARTLIFSTGSYCVLAILWQPGQMSRVHSHRAWCALGVHCGTLTETHFESVGIGLEQGMRLSGCRQLHPGSTSHGPAHDQTAHRVANLGVEPAISIHVYGAAFETLDSELNQVWAD
jgi:predicted metal-dependent enzyme (double-stranded beta helix superfamily)